MVTQKSVPIAQGLFIGHPFPKKSVMKRRLERDGPLRDVTERNVTDGSDTEYCGPNPAASPISSPTASPTLSPSPSLPPGLTLMTEFISRQEENDLLLFIDGAPWNTTLKRRTQHYGHLYDYRSGDTSHKLGPLPPAFSPIMERLQQRGCFLSSPPDQAIVNEYEPGQGIGRHVDSVTSFGPEIASLSLLSPTVMTFGDRRTGNHVDIPLPPRSLVLLTGPSRYSWTHMIAARKGDNDVPRSRRVSITFRTIKK